MHKCKHLLKAHIFTCKRMQYHTLYSEHFELLRDGSLILQNLYMRLKLKTSPQNLTGDRVCIDSVGTKTSDQ